VPRPVGEGCGTVNADVVDKHIDRATRVICAKDEVTDAGA